MTTEFDDIVDMQILVSGTKDATIADAIIVIDSEVIASRGVSKRNPIDKPDEELASLLSSSRALSNLSKKLKRMANARENDLARQAKLNNPKKKVAGGTLHPAKENLKNKEKFSKLRAISVEKKKAYQAKVSV